MTYIEILKRIDTLAPLPKTLMDIEEFKKTDNYDIDDLSRIIETDPLMVSTILKTANSAMFGFVSKIDTLSRAVNLLGVNFTTSIALGTGVKHALNSDLGSYGASSDQFLEIANMQSNLLNLWIGKVDPKLKDELILPAFLQESGKFLISDAINEQKKVQEFLQGLNNNFCDIPSVEKEFVGITTAEVTAAIFRHWNLAPSIVNTIKYSDDASKASPNLAKSSQILSIIKIACNIVKPLDTQAIELAKQKVKEFGLDMKSFENAVEKLEDRLLDAK
jgi:HD-like signal output (HDOD) protein